MQSLTRAALAAVLLLVAALDAPSQTPAAKDTKETGFISGRVTSSDGRPLAGVTIALQGAEPTFDRARSAPRATTDADGRYQVANVPAGRYRVQALAPVYTQPGLRSNPFINDGGKTVNLGPGEAAENVDFVLTRGGVITGRVTSAEGKPVIAERVMITYADQTDQRGFSAMATAPNEFETDDRGVYRVYGLAPGRYFVSVGIDRGPGSISVGVDASPYTRTFYPSTTDASQAKVVEVSSGGEATGIDITLAETGRRYRASGRVVDETGKPVAGVATGYGSLRADAKTIGSSGSDGTLTDDRGEFVIRNLTPGRYAAFVFNGFGSAPTDNYSEAVPFEITDADVTGLVIKVRPGASVSGTITVEGTSDRAVLAKLGQLQLFTEMTSAPGTASDGAIYPPTFINQVPVNPDGSFRIGGLRPGRLSLNLANFRPGARGFALLGITRNGADVSDGIDIGAGEQVTGVRMRIGYGASVVRGTIEVRDGSQPAALPQGMTLRVTARRTNSGDSRYATLGAEVDARGRFVIEGLMGGEYELNVHVFTLPSPGSQTITRLHAIRQTVTVPDGGETIVTVVYDLSKQTEHRP